MASGGKKGHGGAATTSATASEDSGQDNLTDMCVMLVEDDAVARKCAEAALRSCGYRVISAQNGREALDILGSEESEKIDMILTDILMPEVSGLQLLDNVVQSNKWKKLPVTVMSTQDSVNTAAECIQKGAVEFLAKPVRKHKLSNLWQHVLRRKSGNDDGGVSSGASEAKEETQAQAATTTATTTAAAPAPAVDGAGGAAALPPAAIAQAAASALPIPPPAAILANPALLPAWASQLPQALVEIAFKTMGDPMTAAMARKMAHEAQRTAPTDPKMIHSNSCSAFTAFIRCAENGDASAAGLPSTSGAMTIGNAAAASQLAAGVLPHPLQVSNLNIVQQHSGGFRGSGMLRMQDLAAATAVAAKKGSEGAHERRAEAIRKFREKKKARTFKKKVRYESRKRLAEARPRIKGQFVRPEVAAAAAAAAAAAGVAAGVANEKKAKEVAQATVAEVKKAEEAAKAAAAVKV